MEAKALAKRSLNLGLVTWGLLIINVLILFAMIAGLDQSSVPGLGYLPFFLLLLLINVMLNLGGVMIGIVALIKNIRTDKERILIGTAIIGILLNIASVVAVPFLVFAL
jgi:hypothetical protein